MACALRRYMSVRYRQRLAHRVSLTIVNSEVSPKAIVTVGYCNSRSTWGQAESAFAAGRGAASVRLSARPPLPVTRERGLHSRNQMLCALNRPVWLRSCDRSRCGT
jgi:hypothetical protein